MDDIDSWMGVLVLFVIFTGAGWLYGSRTDIRDFQEKPYCQSKGVNGKVFKRCLKAVESDETGNSILFDPSKFGDKK